MRKLGPAPAQLPHWWAKVPAVPSVTCWCSSCGRRPILWINLKATKTRPCLDPDQNEPTLKWYLPMESILGYHGMATLLASAAAVAKSLQSCLTLCDPMDCSPPSCSDQGIHQARILEWVATSSSRGSSQPRDQTHVSCVACIGRWMLYHWATWEDCIYIWLTYSTQIQTIHLIYEHVIGWKYNWRIAEWLSAEKEWAASI